MAKKYLEVMNDGSQDLYILDKEAQDAIGIDTSVEFVDLGLPSGTLWAKVNIGATEETGYGNYYMYGKGATQYNASDSAYDGTENPLAAEADTATVILGAPWHMPTKAQFEELVANTTYSWEENFNGLGINGGKFTAQNGNYVFFPAAGLWYNGEQGASGSIGTYWSSTPTVSSNNAYSLYLAINSKSAVYRHRGCGFPVRPVCDSAPLVKLTSKADKKDTYTKQEVDAKMTALQQKLEGPYYDAEHRCIVYPDYEAAYYDADSKGVIV